MDKARNNMLKTMSKGVKKRKIKPKVTVSAPKSFKLADQNQLRLIEPKIGPPGPKPSLMSEGIKQDLNKQFPILNNEELIQKFLNVPMTNNQKGRIRQLLKDNLKGTSEALMPEVINHRIQAILKNTNLTDSDLRKLRILYNMLKTSLNHNTTEKKKPQGVKTKKAEKDQSPKDAKSSGVKEKKKDNSKVTKMGDVKKTQVITAIHEKKIAVNKDNKESLEKKIKGPKRYVVFLGNLPLGIDKEKIINHFSEMSDHIKDVRIPKQKEEKKSAIAYVELTNEPAFELALSKHHSMLDNRRIKVLYTTQKNSKISKTAAKSKSAKLQALQKSGVLLGSTPMNRRRSQRRKKLKEARAKQQNS